MNFPKSLTALATAAALVAGVSLAYAQSEPANPTGQAGSELGTPAAGATTGAPSTGTVDSSGNATMGTPSAQSDIVSPEPRADRN